MIVIPLNLRLTKLVKARHCWFAEQPEPRDARRLATYFYCRSTATVKGFERTPKTTKLIDLRRSEDEILESFNRNTRYDVRRARKEPLTFGVESQPEKFLAFYNDFARSKGQPLMDEAILRAYWPHLVVLQIASPEETLVTHSYVLDRAVGRATQFQSASLFRTAVDPPKRQLIARANRLLHLEDMLWLKQQGFRTFDLGGYAANTQDPELLRVNEFKDSFGGELAEESTYHSSLLLWLRRLKSIVSPGG